MRNDDATLKLLAEALAPRDRAPAETRVAELRSHVIATRRRSGRALRRIAIAFAIVAAIGGGTVVGYDLPRPIRSALHSLGLPVESTTLVEARAQLDRLGRALSVKDTDEIIAADNAMLGFVKKLDPDEKDKIVPVAHEVHERALALLRSLGICPTVGPCPPGS
jgi:hypothetical protein